MGTTLTVLGIIFLVAGTLAYTGNARDYVAVLIVFSGIFIVIGAGLVTITFVEKKQADPIQKNQSSLKTKDLGF